MAHDEVDEEAPIFAITVAAELAGMHPQTLRQYDRLGLVVPARTQGGSRRYSLRHVKQLREVAALSKKYSDVVIDVGGRDTTSQRAALSVANVALFPFVPRSLDVWTLEKLARLIDEITPANPELKCFAFINRADQALYAAKRLGRDRVETA